MGRMFMKPKNQVFLSGEKDGGTRFTFQTKFDGGFGNWRMDRFPITFTNWHLVHLEYNADSDTNNAAFWVNGNSEPVRETFTPSGTYLGDSGNGFSIGNDPTTSRTWDGKMDEYRIYDGMLSDDWISTEYNNQNNPTSFYTIGTQEMQ